MAARSKTAQPKTGPDSFEAFFRPTKAAASGETETPRSEPPAALAKVAPESGPKLDVNSATTAELLNIPGIGPVLAQRILEARPYQSADELTGVKGIGPKIYAHIRPHFQ